MESRVLVSWKKAEVKEKKMGIKKIYFAVGNVGIGALASSPRPRRAWEERAGNDAAERVEK